MVRRWVPVALWAGLILLLGQGAFSAAVTGSRLIPLLRSLGFSQEAAEFTHGLVRKGGHVTEYGVLGALAERALAAAPVPAAGPARALRAGALSLSVAATDEGLQARTRERTGSALDVALDLAGAGLGIALARRWLRGAPASRAGGAGRGPRRPAARA